MRKAFITAGLLISGFSLSYSQCWKEMSRFLAIKDDGTMWSFANGDTIQVGTDNDWWKVSAGSDHYLAIKTDSTLWGWGNHDHAQLGLGFGNNIPNSYALPTSLGSDHDWIQVSAGQFSSMYLKANGDLYCSGGNGYGQLGIYSTFDQWTIVPVQSIGGNVKNVSTGANGTFAVKNDGTLWFAGARFFLDENDANNQLAFEQQGSDTDWDSVATGLGHCLLLKTNGELWAGGYNNSGQVGNGSYQYVNGRVQIGTENWDKIAVYQYSSYGLKSDGTLYSWGSIGPNQTAFPNQIGTSYDYTGLSVHLASRTYGLYWIGNGDNYLVDACGFSIGLQEQTTFVVSMYPNPADRIVRFDCEKEIRELSILDDTGRIILKRMNGVQKGEILDIENLTQGNYTIQLLIDDKNYYEKLVVLH